MKYNQRQPAKTIYWCIVYRFHCLLHDCLFLRQLNVPENWNCVFCVCFHQYSKHMLATVFNPPLTQKVATRRRTFKYPLRMPGVNWAALAGDFSCGRRRNDRVSSGEGLALVAPLAPCLRPVCESCRPSFCLPPAAIGRTLIPRYFSTVFEGGVTELHYILKHSKESFHNSCITLDCDQCTMVTQHGKPMFTKVMSDPPIALPSPSPSSFPPWIIDHRPS